MLIKRRSQLTGVERELDLPVTPMQMLEFATGGLIQSVFPNLTADQREYILSGITAEEWNEAFFNMDGAT